MEEKLLDTIQTIGRPLCTFQRFCTDQKGDVYVVLIDKAFKIIEDYFFTELIITDARLNVA